MTDDLVKRLRGHADSYDIDAWMSCDEAADFIEQQKKRIAELEAALQKWLQYNDREYGDAIHMNDYSDALEATLAALGERQDG